MIRAWFPTPDLLNFCGFTVRTDLRVAWTVRLAQLQSRGFKTSAYCSLNAEPNCTSTTCDNMSKWFRKQCGVYGDFWSSMAPAG